VTILAVMSGFFLAHNILYTYVASLAGRRPDRRPAAG
jgi:hypothetical protein